MGLKRLHIWVTFIKSFLKTHFCRYVSRMPLCVVLVHSGARGNSRQQASRTSYICRLQTWGREVLEVLEVPVVCSPEPTANRLHGH